MPFLEMPEEEYRAFLEEHGFGDRYIEKELTRLREARLRHDLPGPQQPKEEKIAGNGAFDRLARWRKERRKSMEQK